MNRDRTVYRRRADGKWLNKMNDASKASSTHDTQKEAVSSAKQMLSKNGGELVIKGKNGKIRSKDTIPPGNDPFPPRDTEH